MALDLKTIDWSALAGSKVIIGNVVTILSTIVAITGHSLPADMQSQLTDLIAQVFTVLATVSAVYSTYHRATAQASDATTIIPKKPQT